MYKTYSKDRSKERIASQVKVSTSSSCQHVKFLLACYSHLSTKTFFMLSIIFNSIFLKAKRHYQTCCTLHLQVLEFQTGTLQNLFWKKYGCRSCSGVSVCVNNTDCAVPSSKCKSNGGDVDCNLGIQLAFSGTDKNYNVLNSWYEVANLRQYSLFGLYSNIHNVFTSR